MTLKFLSPSFRTRYLSILGLVENLSKHHSLTTTLNIGCGEGDYDRALTPYCTTLHSGDLNPYDVAFCKEANKDLAIRYQELDAENLPFQDEAFDCILCIEVLEHVNSIEKSLQNIQRALKKGGLLIITVPNSRFPFTYDPINTILNLFNISLPIGAYAYGHQKLITEETLEQQLATYGLTLLKKEHLSHYLVGFFEMYWAGLAQALFKHNSKNTLKRTNKKLVLRSNTQEELWLFLQ